MIVAQACGWCGEPRFEWPKGAPSQPVGPDQLSFCDECMAVFGNAKQQEYAKQRLKAERNKRHA